MTIAVEVARSATGKRALRNVTRQRFELRHFRELDVGVYAARLAHLEQMAEQIEARDVRNQTHGVDRRELRADVVQLDHQREVQLATRTGEVGKRLAPRLEWRVISPGRPR